MRTLLLLSLVSASLSLPVGALDAQQPQGQSGWSQPDCLPHHPTAKVHSGGCLQHLRGWMFRRYAGDVEMVSKFEYPPDYSGSYYFVPWKRSWVEPRNPPLSGKMFEPFSYEDHSIRIEEGASSPIPYESNDDDRAARGGTRRY